MSYKHAVDKAFIPTLRILGVDIAVITLKMENGAIAVIDNSRKAVYGYDQRAEVFGGWNR